MGASMLGAYLAQIHTSPCQKSATTHAFCVSSLCTYEKSSLPVADARIATVSLTLPREECSPISCNTVYAKSMQQCPAFSRLQAPPVFTTNP